MKTLYLECYSGISGDMTVAALLDLGADKDVLMKVLSGIKEPGFKVEISRVSKSGIDCCDFNVILDKEHENHDHDMEYLYGHLNGTKAEKEDHHHEHGESQIHRNLNHEHGGSQIHRNLNYEHGGAHIHRNLKEVVSIIDSLDMTKKARDLAVKIFNILAEAEAKAHNKKIEEVHFHEVGAIDSIVDIVSASVCFDNLGITDVIVPKICEGSGTVRCRHGILPVPVPAVLNIAERYGLPLSITEKQGEYVTPTGAAFIAAVKTSEKLPEILVPEKTGLGAGKREQEGSGILRAILLDS